MIGKLRALLAAVVLAASLIVGFAVAAPEPAGAWYGQADGYVNFSWTAKGRGCAMGFLVMPGMRVQVYCDVILDGTNWATGKTNWHEYSCEWWQSGGCYYEVYISGYPNYRSVGVWTMRKTDYERQHAIIYWARSWQP
jgi:hypothetical protein